jgi:lipopolysaccharide/colanic/teichoic acid biosynthesis glycosyltransferase
MVTLSVRPGLTSPASLYDYARGDELLTGGDVERLYVERLLPVRLALEAQYVRDAGGWYDVRIVVRTLAAIARVALGRRLPDPPELSRLALPGG